MHRHKWKASVWTMFFILGMSAIDCGDTNMTPDAPPKEISVPLEFTKETPTDTAREKPQDTQTKEGNDAAPLDTRAPDVHPADKGTQDTSLVDKGMPDIKTNDTKPNDIATNDENPPPERTSEPTRETPSEQGTTDARTKAKTLNLSGCPGLLVKQMQVDQQPVWRFYHTSGDTIGHSQSGMQSTFSPSGRYLGILYNTKWGILDLQTGRCSNAFQKTISGASIGYLIWTTDNHLVSFNKGQILKVEPMTGKTLASTGISSVNAKWPGHKLDWQSWYSGISVPGPYFVFQHAAGYDGKNLQRRWISVFDAKSWKEIHHFAFDQKVHKGDSSQDRWHEMVFDAPNQTIMISLSAWGPGTNADYRLNMNGTGWAPSSSQQKNRGSVCDDFWSHPTYYHGQVAYGVWQGSTPMMAFGSYQTCGKHTYVPVHGVGKHSWHHGYMTKEYIVVAAIEFKTTKEESYLKVYHIPSKQFTTTILMDQKTPSFLTTARPFISEKGCFCWHSSKYSATGKVDLLCNR